MSVEIIKTLERYELIQLMNKWRRTNEYKQEEMFAAMEIMYAPAPPAPSFMDCMKSWISKTYDYYTTSDYARAVRLRDTYVSKKTHFEFVLETLNTEYKSIMDEIQLRKRGTVVKLRRQLKSVEFYINKCNMLIDEYTRAIDRHNSRIARMQ